MRTPGVDPLPRPGNGFLLRRLSTDDLAAFQAYRHDPELGRYQGWSPMPDTEAIRLIFECSTADRVCGITDARNTASIRLLERVGMRRAETKNAVFRGEPCVEYVYAVARACRCRAGATCSTASSTPSWIS